MEVLVHFQSLLNLLNLTLMPFLVLAEPQPIALPVDHPHLAEQIPYVCNPPQTSKSTAGNTFIHDFITNK